jgi:hypothetical protein
MSRSEDPRDVGMELLRQLDRLDDRLARSQAYLLDLVDRRMPGRAVTAVGEVPTEKTEPPVTPSGPAVVHTPEQRRPAWWSNLITAVIAVAVLLVGLALVGAL